MSQGEEDPMKKKYQYLQIPISNPDIFGHSPTDFLRTMSQGEKDQDQVIADLLCTFFGGSSSGSNSSTNRRRPRLIGVQPDESLTQEELNKTPAFRSKERSRNSRLPENNVSR